MRNPNALKWSDLKTGIFFIFGIGFAAYLGLVIGKNSSLFTGVTTVKVLAGNMHGLAENNFVSVSGKKVGTVSKMEFVGSHDSLYVVADLRLRKEFAGLVTKDSKATIKSLGVLGDKYVDITTGKGASVVDGDFIALNTEDGMAGLTSGAKQAVDRLNTLLEQLNSGKGVAGRLISDEAMGEELAGTIKSLSTTAEELAAMSKKAAHGNGLLAKLINDKKLADNTENTIARLNHAALQADSVMMRINSGEGTLGQLQENPALYNNLTKSLGTLDTLLADLKKNPERYVRFTLFKRRQVDHPSPAGRGVKALLLLLCLAALPSIAPGHDFTPVEKLLQEGVKKQVFPGASIAVFHKGETVFHQAFGNTRCTRHPTPADTTTIYDLASLTKAIATTAIAMQLAERDSLDIDRPASHYLPEFGNNGKERITIRQLLTHTSGLRSHADYIDSCRTQSELFRAVINDTPVTEPGTLTAYSDNGFIVLGKIIEAITRRSLADNFRTRFSGPLSLHSTCFTPGRELQSRVAPTSRTNAWNLNWKRPLVNDLNAAIMGGVAGHAGLFGTTGDLLRFTRMLMEGGELEGKRYFKASTIRRFTRREGKQERALGWDLRSQEGYASTGPEFSEKSWGHLGFTGTSLWIDPEKNLAVIMLSNRVCPSPENKAIKEFRPLLHTAVARSLGYGPAPQEQEKPLRQKSHP